MEHQLDIAYRHNPFSDNTFVVPGFELPVMVYELGQIGQKLYKLIKHWEIF
jgi:hypothetical protein